MNRKWHLREPLPYSLLLLTADPAGHNAKKQKSLRSSSGRRSEALLEGGVGGS